jgi:hypothetical protein
MGFFRKNDTGVRYLEDILKQETFTLDELKNAKTKYPIRSWLKGKKFWIKDSLEISYYKFRRRIKKIINLLAM